MKNALLILCLLVSSVSFAEPIDYRAYITERNHVNTAGDLAVLDYFQSQEPEKAYLIVDKKNRVASFYSSFKVLSQSSNIQVQSGDEMKRGGSGVYFYSRTRDGWNYGFAQKDGDIYPLFYGALQIPSGTVIYVLPEDSSQHRFRIRDNRVTFGAARVLRNRPEFNYSPRWSVYRPTFMATDMVGWGHPVLPRQFVQALQDEKRTLMDLLQLEDDEYNMLAEFSFGVLEPETQFGTDLKYQIKQSFPIAVSIMKGNGFDTSQNSAGPTQIKRIPDVIVEHYKIEKWHLNFPKYAAVTTLAFAAELLTELRNMAYKHPEINEENLQQYLYYLYQGRRNEINNATATPELNVKIRQINEAIKHIEIKFEDVPEFQLPENPPLPLPRPQP